MTAFTPDLYRSEAFAEDLQPALPVLPATPAQRPLISLLLLAAPLALALVGAALSIVAPLS